MAANGEAVWAEYDPNAALELATAPKPLLAANDANGDATGVAADASGLENGGRDGRGRCLGLGRAEGR